jgi:uridine phosphorylase
MSMENNEAQDFLGRHTALSLLKQKPHVWRRIRYLRENDGHAPPIVLAVGDGRRVYAIARRLRNPVLLPETAAKLSNPRLHSKALPSTVEFGRIAMAIGIVFSTPVLVVETQMGSPATQIIMNEILSDQLTSKEYRIGSERIDLPHKIVIRVGTAGGINCEGKVEIKVGDIVNATHSIGATGAMIQTLSRLDFWHPQALEEFRSKWSKLGSDFTITSEGHPRVECSRDVVEVIEAAGTRLAKNTFHRGGNVTKDSLYAERSDDMFIGLCRTENCRTTEMELSAVALAAHEHKASFGMVSAIVGVLPGSSFAQSQKGRKVAEERALRVSLAAIESLDLKRTR